MSTMRAVLLALSFAAVSTAGAQTRQLEATLPFSKPAALARVQSAFADQELPVSSSTGDVVEGRATDRIVKLRYLATLIAVDSATTRVVLTAFGTRPAMGAMMPEAEAQLTSKTGGIGPKAWARLVRLHAALAGDSALQVRKDPHR